MKFFLRLLIIIFLLSGSYSLFAQDSELRKIEGIVFDSSLDNFFIGANIFIEETGEKTITEFDGKFKLLIPKDKDVIIQITKLFKNDLIICLQVIDCLILQLFFVP